MQVYSLSQKKIIDLPDTSSGITSVGSTDDFFTQEQNNYKQYIKNAIDAQDYKAAGDLADEFKRIARFEVSGENPSPTAKAAKEKQLSLNILAGDMALFKDNMGKVWTKGPILGRIASQVIDPDVASFKQLRETLAFSLASAIAGQTGRAASDRDIDTFRNYLPNLTDTPDAASRKLQTAQDQFAIRMKSAGATEQEIQSAISGFGTEDVQPRKNLIQAGIQDIKDLATGTAVLTSTAVKASPFIPPFLIKGGMAEKEKAQSQLVEMAKGTPKAILNDVQDFAQDPVKWISQNPVDTVLLFLPLLSKFKLGKVSKVTEGIAEAGEATKVQKVAQGTVEFLNGAGPKEFIARNVNKDAAQSLAQTALRRDIYSTVTTKGVIQNVQKELTQVGSDLGKVYKNAPPITDTSYIGDSIKQTLLTNYPGQDSIINQIVSKIENMGEPVMAKGTTTITPYKLWKATQNIEEYGLKQIGLGEQGKAGTAIAKDASRTLRQYLYTKIPEAAPLAIDYGNLKVLMETLPDSTGITNLSSLDKLVSKLNFAVDVPKNLTNFISQKIYNLYPPEKIPMIPPEPQLPAVPPETPAMAPVLPANKTPLSNIRARGADTSRWTTSTKLPENIAGSTIKRDLRTTSWEPRPSTPLPETPAELTLPNLNAMANVRNMSASERANVPLPEIPPEVPNVTSTATSNIIPNMQFPKLNFKLSKARTAELEDINVKNLRDLNESLNYLNEELKFAKTSVNKTELNNLLKQKEDIVNLINYQQSALPEGILNYSEPKLISTSKLKKGDVIWYQDQPTNKIYDIERVEGDYIGEEEFLITFDDGQQVNLPINGKEEASSPLKLKK